MTRIQSRLPRVLVSFGLPDDRRHAQYILQSRIISHCGLSPGGGIDELGTQSLKRLLLPEAKWVFGRISKAELF